MTSRRVAASAIALVIAALTACGDDDDGDARAEAPLTSVDGSAEDQAPPAAREDGYCEAMRSLAAAQPPEGTLEADEFEAAFHHYADAAEGAADVSEGADRQLLVEFADLIRTMGSDPAADVVDEVERLAYPMQRFALRVGAECGVSFGDLSG